MDKIFIICLIITTAIVLIWDWFRFPNEFTATIMRLILKVKIKSESVILPKPIGCSTCMTFWITLIVLLCIGPKFCFLSVFLHF